MSVKFLVTIIVGILGILAIPFFMLMQDYYNTPDAEISFQKYCPDKIWLSGTTEFSPLFSNSGEAKGIFWQCVSSDKFLVDNKTISCSNEVDLKKLTDSRGYYYDPKYKIEPRSNIKNVEESSIKVKMFCKQKIWFLTRPCDNREYECRYINNRQWFELTN